MRLALTFPRIDPARGGAETYIVDLCRSLIRAGHQVDLYAESWKEGSLPPEVRAWEVPATGRTRIQRIWNFARNSEKAMGQVEYDCTIGFINTYAHDVIIPQGGVQEGSLLSNARRFRNPLLRGLYLLGKRLNPKYRVYRAIEGRQYAPKRETRVVAVSNMVRRHVQQFHHVSRNLISVIPNAIDADRVRLSQPGATRCAFRNRLGIEPGDLVGLFVGHNFALKGLKPLLHALGARHRGGSRPIHLLVSGAGDVGRYRRIARGLGLDATIHFLGYHPDIRECYAASDFFVLPSYYDPCSLVVLEALAAGLPVITTVQNGAGELLTDGKDGYVLTSPDAQGELIAALDHMADDRRRAAMAEAAAVLGREQSFERHVASLIRVFQEASSARKNRAAHGRHTGSKPHVTKARSRRRAAH
ncbi:MAG: glycosyltransferase family 4 protein [Isosphaeraceae bacterium]